MKWVVLFSVAVVGLSGAQPHEVDVVYLTVVAEADQQESSAYVQDCSRWVECERVSDCEPVVVSGPHEGFPPVGVSVHPECLP